MDQQETRAYNTGLISAMIGATILALVTGLALIPPYKADAATAYASVSMISRPGLMGFLRSVHHWSSAVLIVLGEIYVIAGLFRGAYRKPGQWIWIGSIVLLLIGLAMQITGHLLPFDVQAVRTAVVETGIASDAPVVGNLQGNLMRGGDAVGPATLHLWFVVHIAIFSIVIVLLLVVLARAAKRLGISLANKAWMIGSFVAVLALAVLFQPPLGHPATVSDFSDSGARPEWYILPLHSLLVLAQHVKPNYAFVGTMVIPGIALLLLLALPWIHKRESIPVARTLGMLAAIGIVGLFAYSFADVAPPVGNQVADNTSNATGKPLNIKLDSKLVAKGRQLFSDQGCDACHMVNGKGGKIGPDLSGESSKNRTLDWQVKHMQDPKSVTPGSTMPGFKSMPSDQLNALAQYLTSLKK